MKVSREAVFELKKENEFLRNQNKDKPMKNLNKNRTKWNLGHKSLAKWKNISYLHNVQHFLTFIRSTKVWINSM